eukprot:m.24487 g.24487  ORF g.24487 m.24487 type:complete len:120 (+) comp14619_c0_seq1:763-1122(+)
MRSSVISLRNGNCVVSYLKISCCWSARCPADAIVVVARVCSQSRLPMTSLRPSPSTATTSATLRSTMTDEMFKPRSLQLCAYHPSQNVHTMRGVETKHHYTRKWYLIRYEYYNACTCKR